MDELVIAVLKLFFNFLDSWSNVPKLFISLRSKELSASFTKFDISKISSVDINIYDSVMWSSITPLSELSVASNSQSIKIPDFSGGIWKKENSLEIMREI